MGTVVTPNTLELFHKAVLSITNESDLATILTRIIYVARDLVGADYAALGIVGDDGWFKVFIHTPIDDQFQAHLSHLPQGKGILGAVIKENQTIRLADMTQDSRAHGLPHGHPPMTHFLGVPISYQNEPLGNLYLTNKPDGQPFNPTDEQWVEMLAAHAAIAIHKANLYHQEQAQRQLLALKSTQLRALNEAAVLMTQDLTLEKVLQQIINAAQEVTGAQYVALGVPNSQGTLDEFVHQGMSPEDVKHFPHKPQGLGLLGAIIKEKRSIRITNIQDDDRSVGFPPGHPPMSSFLGMPIWSNDTIVGSLYLTNKNGDQSFTARDEELLEMLAAHAAVAIQNAQLYEQVQQLVVLEERTRIGMDLHDGVIQSIYAMGLTLESTRLALPPDSEDALKLLDIAINGLNDAIRDIRNFILDLRPRRFQGELDVGILQLVREFQANTMIPVETDLSNKLQNLPTSLSRALFLTTQESLANIARHAKADSVYLELQRIDDTIRLLIRDDGRGFNLEDKNRRIGHGLSNMYTRAEEFAGDVIIESTPGQGTTIIMQLPL
ncbi:MAG TPA: GAF domain-containing sensor histidine kinase [Anaerolineae bacterium]|nr:GAF domain-containing sensor histidine kinase [Anaerolineae bacterium]